MKWRKLILSALLIGLTFLVVSFFFQPTLTQMHKKILAKFNNVQHIEPEQLVHMNPNDVLIFDVREKDEFDVSHIEGAIQIAPNISSSDFEEQYGDLIEDKFVVFYCSVGMRSSKLASLVNDVIEDNGANAAYNLTGGVFQWHNENRPLINLSRAVINQVHPYNPYWGRLINDQNSVRYEPSPSEK